VAKAAVTGGRPEALADKHTLALTSCFAALPRQINRPPRGFQAGYPGSIPVTHLCFAVGARGNRPAPDAVGPDMADTKRGRLRIDILPTSRHVRVTLGDTVLAESTALPESRPIAGLVAFYDDRVEVTVDGEQQGG
jgi:hypothetical protein